MIQQETFFSLQKELQQRQCTLVAVSKLKSIAAIQALYDLGQRDFGENYVQELVEKQAQLPKDIRWHFIGHLQSNKVKYIAPFVHMIHSVDSFKLIKEINKQGKTHQRKINILLQVYLGQEITKFGMDEKETLELLSYYDAQQNDLPFINIRGLMGMASFVADEAILKHEFNALHQMFQIFKIQFFLGKEDFDTRSMGMSGDYQIALDAGSNMVRIGSSIFGARS